MAVANEPTSAQLQKFIKDYEKSRPSFVVYATVLERILKAACKHAVPEAMVQTRAKTVSSFAEKCVRKWPKYDDPIHQMTDLCGARIVVQTLEQVKAAQPFIETAFVIEEKDDKIEKLDLDQFGYRDLHYIIRLKPGPKLGITPAERAKIGDRRAELQVRTWVQHAWADTLHDRLYKAKLSPSLEMLRTGALLAAIMEDGDRTFDRLAAEIDGRAANYTKYATREKVDKEIAARRLILANEHDAARKPALSLGLAQLVASASGDYGQVVTLLEPYKSISGQLRCELIMELGYALCKVNRVNCRNSAYRQGQHYLEEAEKLSAVTVSESIPSLRRDRSVRARTLARLAWSWECDQGTERLALHYHRLALECEPKNPYYLANLLGFEIFCAANPELPASTRIAIKQAIAACRDHALAGIEMPYACFTAGRLALLLASQDDAEPQTAYDALSWYAAGLRHCRQGDYCVPKTVIEEELEYLQRIHFGKLEPRHIGWAKWLLNLAQASAAPGKKSAVQLKHLTSAKRPEFKDEVLVIAGGAISFQPKKQPKDKVTAKDIISDALHDYEGSMVAGGTTAGIPGLVGAAATAHKGRQYHLIGYIPRRLPQDAKKDGRYDEIVVCTEDSFSPEQILRNWTDMLVQGRHPADVRLLGFGGGPLSAIEYHIALAMGATVAVVSGTQGAADAIMKDPLWNADLHLLPVPYDKASVRAFVFPAAFPPAAANIEAMAVEFHDRYIQSSTHRFPENLRPWIHLSDTFRKANLEQARCTIAILNAAGFEVRKASKKPGAIKAFKPSDLEVMARLEHGRWNIERLRDGWRPGSPRDDALKIHDKLVPWEQLDQETRKYDYNAVRAYPEILAIAGLEIWKPSGKR